MARKINLNEIRDTENLGNVDIIVTDSSGILQSYTENEFKTAFNIASSTGGSGSAATIDTGAAGGTPEDGALPVWTTDSSIGDSGKTLSSIAFEDEANTFSQTQTFTQAPILTSGSVSVGGNTVVIPGEADTLVNLAGSQTLSNKILVDPQIGAINGTANDTKVAQFTDVVSGVNFINFTNGATGTGATITATGADADVDLNLTTKGAGVVRINGKEVTTLSGAKTEGVVLNYDANGDLVATAQAVSDIASRSSNNTFTGSNLFNVAISAAAGINVASGQSILGGGDLTVQSGGANSLSLIGGSGDLLLDAVGGNIVAGAEVHSPTGEDLVLVSDATKNVKLQGNFVELVNGNLLSPNVSMGLISNDGGFGFSSIFGPGSDVFLVSAPNGAGDSGDMNLDAGTATGTAGVVNVGTTNATAVNIGSASADVGIVNNLNVGGNTVITGDLTVQGTTTTVNSTTVEIVDMDFTIAKGATAADITAAGGAGIIVNVTDANDESILWTPAQDTWAVSGNLNLEAARVFSIDGSEVLSSTALGAGVVSSSLTSVGTLTSGTWNATEIGVEYGGTGLTSIAANEIIYGSASNTMGKLAVGTGELVGNVGSGVAVINEASLLANFKLYRHVERFTLSGGTFTLASEPVDGESITAHAVNGGLQNNYAHDNVNADFAWAPDISESGNTTVYYTHASLGNSELVDTDVIEVVYFSTKP